MDYDDSSTDFISSGQSEADSPRRMRTLQRHYEGYLRDNWSRELERLCEAAHEAERTYKSTERQLRGAEVAWRDDPEWRGEYENAVHRHKEAHGRWVFHATAFHEAMQKTLDLRDATQPAARVHAAAARPRQRPAQQAPNAEQAAQAWRLMGEALDRYLDNEGNYDSSGRLYGPLESHFVSLGGNTVYNLGRQIHNLAENGMRGVPQAIRDRLHRTGLVRDPGSNFPHLDSVPRPIFIPTTSDANVDVARHARQDPQSGPHGGDGQPSSGELGAGQGNARRAGPQGPGSPAYSPNSAQSRSSRSGPSR